MLNEETKDRLIKAIFTLKKEDEEISDEDLKLAEELIETHPDLTDLDRKIVKLRIYQSVTYREITDLLEIEKSHTAQNRFNQSMSKIRKSLRKFSRPDDGTEQLSDLMKNRKGLNGLKMSQIYTIGQLTDHLKKFGKLKDPRFSLDTAASIIYYLDRDGYDLRKLVTDKRLLEEFEELDRRNYVQVDQLQDLIKSQKSVNLVERVTNSYTGSSKTEFGSFDVFLSNGSKVRLRATIKPLESHYELSVDIESSKKYERFDYSEKMTHSVSTDSENLEEALQFLLLAASTN
jgi:hypothetical protein